jgi:hypothetical protein
MTDELVTALAPPTSTSACPVGAALDDGRPLRSPLTGLDAAAFAHPLDRQAIAALRRLKGFDWAVAKVIEWQHERPAHVLHSASSVRVNAKQLPKLHGLLLEACLVLDLEPPELYVAGAAGVNAYTSGHNHPYIVLHSDLVEVMDDDELLAVIAHELGHVKCQHVLYKEMVRWLTNMGAHGLSRSRLRSSTTQLLVGHVLSALLTWDQAIGAVCRPRRASRRPGPCALHPHVAQARRCTSPAGARAGRRRVPRPGATPAGPHAPEPAVVAVAKPAGQGVVTSPHRRAGAGAGRLDA